MHNLFKRDTYLFKILSLMLISFIWISFLCAILSIFYISLILISWIIINFFLFKKKILIFKKPSKEFIIYSLIILLFLSLVAVFTEPTIFAGRDQGSIADTSLKLAQNHSLLYKNNAVNSFFEVYGKGEALNFPGFYYTTNGNLLTQFPIPYISFLASFIEIFGLIGFALANLVLNFFFILALVFLVKYFLNKKYVFVFLLLFLTSFTLSFFAKFTLSENLAGALLWISIFFYLLIREKLNNKNYFAFFLSISILPFLRIEGFWFFVIFVFIFLRKKENRQFIFQNSWQKIILPLVILTCIFFANLIMNTPFYYTMGHVILDKFQAKENIPAVENEKIEISYLEKTNFLFNVYSLYGLFFPLILTALMCFKSVLNKKYRFFILPIGIILPLFFYYLSPQISLDHPWMLRRFSFALVPVTLVMSLVFIASIGKKWFFTKYILIFILLISNLVSFIPFFTYRENIGLKEQVHELAQQFGENDLILIDRNVAGNGWTMITTPLSLLENKQAVYFFNPEDFYKLNLNKFDRVFLIVPNENEDHYLSVLKNEMMYYNDYKLNTNQLKIAESKTLPVFLPENENLKIEGKIWELNK